MDQNQGYDYNQQYQDYHGYQQQQYEEHQNGPIQQPDLVAAAPPDQMQADQAQEASPYENVAQEPIVSGPDVIAYNHDGEAPDEEGALASTTEPAPVQDEQHYPPDILKTEQADRNLFMQTGELNEREPVDGGNEETVQRKLK